MRKSILFIVMFFGIVNYVHPMKKIGAGPSANTGQKEVTGGGQKTSHGRVDNKNKGKLSLKRSGESLDLLDLEDPQSLQALEKDLIDENLFVLNFKFHSSKKETKPVKKRWLEDMGIPLTTNVKEESGAGIRAKNVKPEKVEKINLKKEWLKIHHPIGYWYRDQLLREDDNVILNKKVLFKEFLLIMKWIETRYGKNDLPKCLKKEHEDIFTEARNRSFFEEYFKEYKRQNQE